MSDAPNPSIFLFRYIAVDKAGETSTGTFLAPSRDSAVNTLVERGYHPKKVELALTDKRYNQKKITEEKRKDILDLFKIKKVSPKRLMVFSRQLATLLRSGLPLIKALKMLHNQNRKGELKRVILSISEGIQDGETISQAFERHPHVFNPLYIHMVKGGEFGGVLDVALMRIADYQEKAEKLKGKIGAALVYPLLVFVITVLIVAGLLVYIVPRFQKIFNSILDGKPLPLLTRVVLGASAWVKDNILYIGLLIFVLGVAYTVLMKRPFFIQKRDQLLWKLPVIGQVTQKGAIARFARTFGTLMSSGVPILQALRNSQRTSGTTVMDAPLDAIYESLKSGDSLVEPVRASGVFDEVAIGMIETGEEVGNLPEMLIKVAGLYEEEVENIVGGMLTMIEPVMIVVLAVIIGSIVASLFLPLISIMSGLMDSQ